MYSTTLQVAFDKTSPEPTKDRLRIQNRKNTKESKKRVRSTTRTGNPHSSHKGGSPRRYGSSKYKKYKTVRRNTKTTPKGSSGKPILPIWLMYTIIIVVIVVVFGLVAYPTSNSPNNEYNFSSFYRAPVAKELIAASTPKPTGNVYKQTTENIYDLFGE